MTSPIFIIGSPRSGTTVVAWALGQHPELWTGGEFHLLWRLFGDERLENLLAKELAFPGVIRRGEVTRAQFLEDVGSGFNTLFSRLSGGRRWVDQTPVNTFMADTLAAMFPTAKFIHLLRDGREVVESMVHFGDVHTPERRRELEKLGYFPAWALEFKAACREWTKSVEAAERFREAHPERCMTARYKDLVTDADAFFAEIFAFLGCGPSDKPARFSRTQRINSSFADSPDPAARPAAGTSWSSDQNREFMEIAGPKLAGTEAPESESKTPSLA